MFKYNAGDRLGQNNILMLDRTKKDKNGLWFGIFQCPFCNNSFETRISDITTNNTNSCGCLSKKQKSINGQNNMKNLIGQSFGLLTVIEKTNKRESRHIIWKCECACGNTCEVPSNRWKKTYSCGCIISKGEQKIQQILEKNNILFEKQKEFETLIYNGNKLRFDFYLPKENILIEYDGIQHFKYSNSGWDTKEKFELTKQRDEYKNKWCKENNIPLIRIPYYDIDKIEYSFLQEKIKELS